MRHSARNDVSFEQPCSLSHSRFDLSRRNFVHWCEIKCQARSSLLHKIHLGIVSVLLKCCD